MTRARCGENNATALLQVQHLRIELAGRTLVTDLSLQAMAGQRWAVLGANGAGKSTLLLTLAGLRPDSGTSIRLQGHRLADLAPIPLARLRAYAEQQPHDAFSQTVCERVAQARSPFEGRWWIADGRGAKVDSALQEMDLEELAARDLLQLSGGERQRVTVAAALAQDTPLLLLDEPTAHLDPAHQALVFSALRRRESTLTMLALHDVNLALRHCTHAVMLMPQGCVAGPIGQIITEASLEQTFDCRARLIDLPDDGGQPGLAGQPGQPPRRLVLWA